MQTILKGIIAEDRNAIEEILRSTDFFYEFEIQTALELAELVKALEEKFGISAAAPAAAGAGAAAVEEKIIDDDGLIAFANYGKNDFSTHSWELYWIAVHQNSRNKKLGSVILKVIEEDIRKAGGKILWIETSGRPHYASTEAFYKRNGYDLHASLKDFYADGDPKQIYSKVL